MMSSCGTIQLLLNCNVSVVFVIRECTFGINRYCFVNEIIIIKSGCRRMFELFGSCRPGWLAMF